MNDLLRLKKEPSSTTSTIEIKYDQVASQVEHKHQQPIQTETTVKSKEKSNINHKRPLLSQDLVCSKRAKGQETIKPTPQLMNQLMTSTGCIQKARTKTQTETPTSNGWSQAASPQKASQQPASNSVLMNLLVSGCDVSAGYYTCLPRPKVAKA